MTVSAVEFMLNRFERWSREPALVSANSTASYGDLTATVYASERLFKEQGITTGSVVVLVGDYDLPSVASLLALFAIGAIVAPLTAMPTPSQLAILDASWIIAHDGQISKGDSTGNHPLLIELKDRRHPGLLVFTSGSSGQPKVIVHDVKTLMTKFYADKKPQRLITFLLFDHMGGLNTLFHSLSSGSMAVFLKTRNPEEVACMIAQYKVEVLPTTPSFLNLLLVHEVHKTHDMSSLTLITYGTEPMPELTLKRTREALPHAKLLQTYGLSEVGVLRTASQSDGSLLLKFNDPNLEWRIINDQLELKVVSTMVGYLNAPSPLTDDGWFMTGDYVELHGEYLKIIGRKSELIIVAGDKFHPREVEDQLRTMDNILEVTVHAEANPLIGQVVAVTVALKAEEDPEEFKKRLRAFCRNRLPRTRLPRAIYFAKESLYSERMKKTRGAPHAS